MKILSKLVIKTFHVKSLTLGEKFSLKEGHLTAPETAGKLPETFDEVKISVINPGDPDKFINTIMDICPISSKVVGKIGEGVTHTLTGVYMMLTGVDTDGNQMHEFGSSEGMLSEQLVRNKAGTPSESDIILHIDIVLKPGQSYRRPLAFSMFEFADIYLQDMRERMKIFDGRNADEVHEYIDKRYPGKPKVAIVKQISGQGAMYDNQIFPDEPSGILGGKSIIDYGNIPIFLTPNEYRDGAIHAMD